MHAHFGWYGIAVATLLIAKLLLSIKRRPAPKRRTVTATSHIVHGVITSFNEDPAALRRCLQSILDQTRRPDSLTLIDDCSKDHSAQQVVEGMRPAFEAAGIRLDFIRFPVNRGKREGLAAGTRTSTCASTPTPNWTATPSPKRPPRSGPAGSTASPGWCSPRTAAGTCSPG